MVKRWQNDIFKKVDKACKNTDGYRGFHLLVFEKTNPEDGKMWLDHKLITKDDLINFLMFKEQKVEQPKMELIIA